MVGSSLQQREGGVVGQQRAQQTGCKQRDWPGSRGQVAASSLIGTPEAANSAIGQGAAAFAFRRASWCRPPPASQPPSLYPCHIFPGLHREGSCSFLFNGFPAFHQKSYSRRLPGLHQREDGGLSGPRMDWFVALVNVFK